MTYRLFSLLVVVICMMTATALCGQNKPSGKSWQKLGENDSLVIEPLSINSSKDDYAPIFINGVLYFTSNRKNRHTDEAALQYNENIYTSHYIDHMWSSPKMFYFLNNDDYTALAGYSIEGPQLFTYKTFGEGDLYRSVLGEKQWSRPLRMKSPINSSYHDQSAAESNNIMVISSERPGGHGKHDLYWAIANDAGEYIDFIPLDFANTEGDEVDVSLSSDGKILYFSSDVGGKSGGYDIFCMYIDKDRQWSKPEALSINTSADDRWFFNADSMFFYSHSGETGDDIYWGHILPKCKRDTIKLQKIIPRDANLDTLLVHNLVNLNQRPTEQLFFKSDGTPDTLKQQKLIHIYDKLDSLQFQVTITQVQVGAYYYIRSVDEFKYNFEAFDTTDIQIEKVETKRGTLYKYMINKKYKTLAESALRQQEAIKQQTADVNRSYYPKGKPYDAFIVAYDTYGKRIIIYFNVETMDYRILVGDDVLHY